MINKRRLAVWHDSPAMSGDNVSVGTGGLSPLGPLSSSLTKGFPWLTIQRLHSAPVICATFTKPMTAVHSGCCPRLSSLRWQGAFCGPVATVKCFEDNTLVKAALDTPGQGRVLVVDGGASLRRALVGGNLAAAGARNGWAGWSSTAACGTLRSCGPLPWASAPWGSCRCRPKTQ